MSDPIAAAPQGPRNDLVGLVALIQFAIDFGSYANN
jgi:hypothetical protein